MHRQFYKDSKKSSFTILQFFYKSLPICKVDHPNMHKSKKRNVDLASGTLQFPQIKLEQIDH